MAGPTLGPIFADGEPDIYDLATAAGGLTDAGFDDWARMLLGVLKRDATVITAAALLAGAPPGSNHDDPSVGLADGALPHRLRPAATHPFHPPSRKHRHGKQRHRLPIAA